MTRPPRSTLRYVVLPKVPSLAQIDDALKQLSMRRRITNFAIVRGWIDAEIDTVLDMRDAAVLDDQLAH